MRPWILPLALASALLLPPAATTLVQAQPAVDLLRQTAVLTLPGMESVKVDTGVVYSTAAGRALKLDFFHPLATKKEAKPPAARAPVVIFVNAVGLDEPPLRRWGIYQSWGRLVATSGMAAVTHDCRREAPREDLAALVTHLRQNADRYGIDPDQIGIWACSANLRDASWYALNPANPHVKAAVFYYGNVDTTYLRTDLPVLVGRAGLDNPGTNASLDGFVWRALRRNAAVSLFNIPNGRHAFDAFDPEETSKEAVRATLEFLRANLSPEMQAARGARAEQRLLVERHAARDWDGAIAAAKALLEKEPRQPQAWQLMGDAHYNLRQYRESAENYDRAGESGYNAAFSYYNAGCAWALAGERDRALTSLERAVATGFLTNRRGMADDPDLASLKDDPRFQKLVQAP